MAPTSPNSALVPHEPMEEDSATGDTPGNTLLDRVRQLFATQRAVDLEKLGSAEDYMHIAFDFHVEGVTQKMVGSSLGVERAIGSARSTG